MAGLVNIVPNGYAYAALAFTTFPLALRRAAPWPTLAISVRRASSSRAASCRIRPVGRRADRCRLHGGERADGRHAVGAGIATAIVMLVAPTPLPSETLAAIMRVQNAVFAAAAVSLGFAVRSLGPMRAKPNAGSTKPSAAAKARRTPRRRRARATTATSMTSRRIPCRRSRSRPPPPNVWSSSIQSRRKRDSRYQGRFERRARRDTFHDTACCAATRRRRPPGGDGASRRRGVLS